jgi:5'-nucleotidase
MKRRIQVFGGLALVLICFFTANGCLFGQSSLKILISNDDGIDAPGIAVLFEKLSSIALVTVAAPAQNYSLVSHSITSQDPIMISVSERNGSKWFAIKALPATCVRLALESLLPDKPDLVVSGINRGENLGVVSFYSATVACSREAAIKGIPAVAVSLESGKTMDYAPAADFVLSLVQEMKEKRPKPGMFLNVNVPNLPKDKIKGVAITRQDTQTSLESYERRVGPGNQVYFWNLYKELQQAPEGTDVWAVRNGFISISPFQIDQTDYQELKGLENWNIIKGKNND